MSIVPIQRLGDVAEFIRGITFKPDDVIDIGETDAVACMRTKNVQSDLDLSDVWGIPKSFVKRSDQFLREGDILVSTANSWNLVGKCCWVPELAQDSTLGGFISALRSTSENLDSRYLYHWFSFDPVQALVRNCARKTTNIANLSFDQCLALRIPVPPLDEQKRIAAILDQADELRRQRQRAIDRLNQLGQAIFHEMFGDLIRNEKDWPKIGVLSDFAEIISGITKGRKIKGLSTRPVPYLAVVNVQDKRLKLEPLKEIDATDVEIKKYLLKRNDLLLTEGGDPDKLGRGTLWNEELAECIHQNHVFRVRIRSSKINPVYLNWLVGSSYGKSYFLKSAKQTTGIASINSTQLKAFPMIMPPLATQERFADRLQQIDLVSVRFVEALGEQGALFQSLQHRAFRGEL